MKILFIAHLYPPFHIAGAEVYIQNLGKYLISKGHEVRVLIRQANQKTVKNHYEYDGIKVFASHIQNTGPIGINEEQITWATHLIAHLENMEWTVTMARAFKMPGFFISHNSWDYPCIHQRSFKPEARYPIGVIYNSFWMQKQLNYPQRSIILHPPLNSTKVINNNHPEKAKKITIINSNERKGGAIFRQIAMALPDYEFMIVLGGYDAQIVPSLSNVIAVGPGDMLEFYAQTRILLIPSAYESWSMCCNEAMASGIPVICSKTPGLMENAGEAGIYVDSHRMQRWMELHEPPKDMEDTAAVNNWILNEQTPAFDYFDDEKSIINNDDIDMWIEKIKTLDVPEYYFHVSEKCRKRAAELDPRKELEAVEKFIQNAATDN